MIEKTLNLPVCDVTNTWNMTTTVAPTDSVTKSNSSEIVDYCTPNRKTRFNFKRLTPNFFTHKRPFRMNVSKQTKELKKRLKTYTPFELQCFELSKTGISASLPNVHPMSFKAFTNILCKFCGTDSSLKPLCNAHTMPFLVFSYQESCDSSDPPNMVNIILEVSQLVGNNQIKLGSVTAHFTKCRIQVQGSKDNVQYMLHTLIAPLI